jgi:hypothetical protein
VDLLAPHREPLADGRSPAGGGVVALRRAKASRRFRLERVFLAVKSNASAKVVMTIGALTFQMGLPRRTVSHWSIEARRFLIAGRELASCSSTMRATVAS